MTIREFFETMNSKVCHDVYIYDSEEHYTDTDYIRRYSDPMLDIEVYKWECKNDIFEFWLYK
jgi:hypothetical protein